MPSRLRRFACRVLNKRVKESTTNNGVTSDPRDEIISPEKLRLVKAHMAPLILFQKLNASLMGLNVLSLVFLIILLMEHASLYPLVENQTIYAEFIGADYNYVNVSHTKETRNERLIESILRRYVIEREQIVEDPSRVVEKFSSPVVYDKYFEVLKTIANRNLRPRLRRFIKILRYQVIESNIRQFEVEFTDLIKFINQEGEVKSRFDKSIWLINIKFDFYDVVRKRHEVNINPAGLFVTAYQIKRVQ